MISIHQIKEIVRVDKNTHNTSQLFVVCKKTHTITLKTQVKIKLSKPYPTTYRNNYSQPSVFITL